jgi:hypothetical protein
MPDGLRERHLHVVLTPTLLLPVLPAYSLRSSCVGSPDAVPRLLPSQGCSSRVPCSFSGRASLNRLLRSSAVFVTGTSVECWTDVLPSAWCMTVKSCMRCRPPPPGFLQALPPRLYHTKPLLPRCCPSYRGMNTVAPSGCRSDTFPSPSLSAWCVRSTDIVGVHDV